MSKNRQKTSKNVKKRQKTLFFRVFRKNRVLGPFWGRGGSRDLQKWGGRPMDARAKPNLHARMTVYLEGPPPGGPGLFFGFFHVFFTFFHLFFTFFLTFLTFNIIEREESK